MKNRKASTESPRFHSQRCKPKEGRTASNHFKIMDLGNNIKDFVVHEHDVEYHLAALNSHDGQS